MNLNVWPPALACAPKNIDIVKIYIAHKVINEIIKLVSLQRAIIVLYALHASHDIWCLLAFFNVTRQGSETSVVCMATLAKKLNFHILPHIGLYVCEQTFRNTARFMLRCCTNGPVNASGAFGNVAQYRATTPAWWPLSAANIVDTFYIDFTARQWS